MDFWNDLFTALDAKESWLVLFWVGLAAFLGLLIGMTLRGFGVSKWKRRFRAKESELKALQAEFEALKEKYALQEADRQKADLRIEELEAQIRRMDMDQTQLQNDLSVYEQQYNGLKSTLEESQSDRQNLGAKIEQLETHLAELKSENDRLNAEAKANQGVLGDMASFQSSFNATKNQLANVESRLANLEEENGNLKDELNAMQAIAAGENTPLSFAHATNSRSIAAPDALTLAMIEEKISTIEDENIMLKQELSELRGGEQVNTVLRRTVPRDMEPFNEDLTPDEIDEKDAEILNSISPEELSAQATAKLTAALGEQIPRATEADRDDLKKINGIGPFIEQKLNSLGIFTFEQVSLLDAGLITTLTNAIQFFPGRIERDNWVGQAAALHRAKKEKDINPTEPDHSHSKEDLKVVEGIGPKIEQLLKDNGIHTWEQLASTNISRLKEILDAAGSNYRIHSPTTWPDQAKLASLGEWEKLQQFQSYLTSGKNNKKE